jgi:hypothetical protein
MNIIQVLIVSVVLSTAAIIATKRSSIVSKRMAYNTYRSDIKELARRVNTLLSRHDYCDVVPEIIGVDVSTPVTITEITHPDFGTIVATNETYGANGKITVSNLQLSRVNSELVNLNITALIDDKKSIGVKTIVEAVPLKTVQSGNVIQQCFADKDSEVRDALEAFCNGTGAILDSNHRCLLIGVEETTCPSGQAMQGLDFGTTYDFSLGINVPVMNLNCVDLPSAVSNSICPDLANEIPIGLRASGDIDCASMTAPSLASIVDHTPVDCSGKAQMGIGTTLGPNSKIEVDCVAGASSPPAPAPSSAPAPSPSPTPAPAPPPPSPGAVYSSCTWVGGHQGPISAFGMTWWKREAPNLDINQPTAPDRVRIEKDNPGVNSGSAITANYTPSSATSGSLTVTIYDIAPVIAPNAYIYIRSSTSTATIGCTYSRRTSGNLMIGTRFNNETACHQSSNVFSGGSFPASIRLEWDTTTNVFRCTDLNTGQYQLGFTSIGTLNPLDDLTDPSKPAAFILRADNMHNVGEYIEFSSFTPP